MSELILGIDLGTTNSAVGIVDSGFPILLANEDGRRITPSAVWIGADGSVEVGEKAVRRQAAEPERVITSIKRLMGCRTSELGGDFPIAVTNGPDGYPQVLGKKPEEVSAEILREMKRIAEEVGQDRFRQGKFDEACTLFVRLSLAPRFEEFLTLPAYDLVTASSVTA